MGPQISGPHLESRCSVTERCLFLAENLCPSAITSLTRLMPYLLSVSALIVHSWKAGSQSPRQALLSGQARAAVLGHSQQMAVSHQDRRIRCWKLVTRGFREEALWGSSWDSRVSRNWVGLGGGKKKARENVVLNRSFGKVLFISTEGFCS